MELFMTWESDENKLTNDFGKMVAFEYPIEQIFEKDNICVVLLDVRSNQTMTNNVYGVVYTGEIKWQIGNSNLTGEPSRFPYTEISDNSCHGIINCYNFEGFSVKVSLATGRIVYTEFVRY